MEKEKQINELERLRTEAQSLQHEERSPVTPPPSPTVTEEDNTLSASVDKDDKSDMNSQLAELVDVLEQELKDTNPITLLIVFALGILIGRLLPR